MSVKSRLQWEEHASKEDKEGTFNSPVTLQCFSVIWTNITEGNSLIPDQQAANKTPDQIIPTRPSSITPADVKSHHLRSRSQNEHKSFFLYFSPSFSKEALGKLGVHGEYVQTHLRSPVSTHWYLLKLLGASLCFLLRCKIEEYWCWLHPRRRLQNSWTWRSTEVKIRQECCRRLKAGEEHRAQPKLFITSASFISLTGLWHLITKKKTSLLLFWRGTTPILY